VFAASLYESLVCVGLMPKMPLNAAGILTEPAGHPLEIS
jgi:hypothetical protein